MPTLSLPHGDMGSLWHFLAIPYHFFEIIIIVDEKTIVLH